MATIEYVDLLLDNGELVCIEYRSKYADEFWDYLNNCIKRKDTWSAGRYEGTKAKYMGLGIDRVNTGRVVGTI